MSEESSRVKRVSQPGGAESESTAPQTAWQPEPATPPPCAPPKEADGQGASAEKPSRADEKGLDIGAFEGVVSELLKSEGLSQGATPESSSASEPEKPDGRPSVQAEAKQRELDKLPRAPRLLDQFDWLRSKNAELARKEAERKEAERKEAAKRRYRRPPALRPGPRGALIEKPLEKPRPSSSGGEAGPGQRSGVEGFLKSLRTGRFDEAEDYFAEVMGLEPPLAKRILYSAELEDLAVICRALGLRSLEYATIVALLRGSRSNGGFSASEGLKGSLGVFQSVDRDGALKLMELIPGLPQRDWSTLKRL